VLSLLLPNLVDFALARSRQPASPSPKQCRKPISLYKQNPRVLTLRFPPRSAGLKTGTLGAKPSDPEGQWSGVNLLAKKWPCQPAKANLFCLYIAQTHFFRLSTQRQILLESLVAPGFARGHQPTEASSQNRAKKLRKRRLRLLFFVSIRLLLWGVMRWVAAQLWAGFQSLKWA
jgi:hypothetical protein